MWKEAMKIEHENRLTVYNKDKSVYGIIDEKDAMYPKLVSCIKEKGVCGDKGFFYSIFNSKENKLEINPTILPPELW